MAFSTSVLPPPCTPLAASFLSDSPAAAASSSSSSSSSCFARLASLIEPPSPALAPSPSLAERAPAPLSPSPLSPPPRPADFPPASSVRTLQFCRTIEFGGSPSTYVVCGKVAFGRRQYFCHTCHLANQVLVSCFQIHRFDSPPPPSSATVAMVPTPAPVAIVSAPSLADRFSVAAHAYRCPAEKAADRFTPTDATLLFECSDLRRTLCHLDATIRDPWNFHGSTLKAKLFDPLTMEQTLRKLNLHDPLGEFPDQPPEWIDSVTQSFEWLKKYGCYRCAGADLSESAVPRSLF